MDSSSHYFLKNKNSDNFIVTNNFYLSHPRQGSHGRHGRLREPPASAPDPDGAPERADAPA